MSGSYLEHFLESLDTLPSDLQRNFTLMRELDIKAHDLVAKINTESENYMDVANELDDKEKIDKYKEIRTMFGKAKELSDDKIQLSLQTYEMIDKHIRSLDSQLTKLEAELKEKLLYNSATIADDGKKKGRAKSRGRSKKSGFTPKNAIKEEVIEKGKKKQKISVNDSVLTSLANDTSLFASIAGPTEVLDMPVDPNEPTYCLCHQVSYGEMIGCDNPECPIEWFHFGCVGLQTKPKGKWFCPKCSDRKKK